MPMLKTIMAELAAQRHRWALWLPVLYGAGVAGALLNAWPLTLWPTATMVASLVSVLLIGRRWPAVQITALMALTMALGVLVALAHSDYKRAPVLPYEVRQATIIGTTLSVEALPDKAGYRLVLTDISLPETKLRRVPRLVRLTVTVGEAPMVGARVRLVGSLFPPRGAAFPGGYNFARQAYFDQLGAVGFADTAPEVIAAASTSASQLWFKALRQKISTHVRAVLPGDAGAVAVALITGEQRAISEDTKLAMRDAGLTHLLAISGLNLALAAGIVFFVIRRLLLLIPNLADTQPIKKWAMVAAFMAALFYTALADWQVPVMRALIMVGLVTVAVLTDRRAVTMRTAALAALLILTLSPQAVLTPSFQLSFLAVVGLIALAETPWRRWPVFYWFNGSLIGRILFYVLTVALTSAVATVFTTPATVYHFHRFNLYGILTNIIAVPLTALWIMPLLILNLAFWPLEWSWLWQPIGWGIDGIISLAVLAARLPYASLQVAGAGAGMFVLMVLGLLWLSFWHGRVRWFGIVPLLVGAYFSASADFPRLLVVLNDDRVVAVLRGDDNQAYLTGGLPEFIKNEALEKMGVSGWQYLNRAPATERCRNGACIVAARITLVWRLPSDIDAICAANQLLLNFARERFSCPNNTPVLARRELRARGGLAVWDNGVPVFGREPVND